MSTYRPQTHSRLHRGYRSKRGQGATVPYVTVFEAIDADVDLSVLGIRQIVKAGESHLIHGNVTEMLSVNSRRISFNRLVSAQQLKITIRPATEGELGEDEAPVDPPAANESSDSEGEKEQQPVEENAASSESQEAAASAEVEEAEDEDNIVVQNEVTLEQLTAVKGIGKSTAEKVLALDAVTAETLQPVINDALIPEVLALYAADEE